MDTEGRHTDWRGALLNVGTLVRMREDNELSGEVGTGKVVALPPAGNDYYGFPLVEFDHDGRKRHVADTALVVDNTARVTVTNRHGTFFATADEMDAAMSRHLPASVLQLRQAYAAKTGTDVSLPGTTVTELLVMLAEVERDMAANPNQSNSEGPGIPNDVADLIIASWSEAKREWQVSARATGDADWVLFEGSEDELDQLMSLARDTATGG